MQNFLYIIESQYKYLHAAFIYPEDLVTVFLSTAKTLLNLQFLYSVMSFKQRGLKLSHVPFVALLMSSWRIKSSPNPEFGEG